MKRNFALRLLVAASAVGLLLTGPAVTPASAAATNTTVDFTRTTATLAPSPFSSTISTYGAYNTSIAQSAAQVSALANLHAGYYRIPLQWNGGNVISSAAGGPAGISGDAWINAIDQIGQPEIVVGGSTDDNFTPSDAASLVRHFNKPASGQAHPVRLWVIGNEPDVAGMPIQTYCTLFNNTVAAMKAVDPTIEVAGPAWSYFNPTILSEFLQCAGGNLDVLDFHGYGMGEGYVSNATALATTPGYGSQVSQARQLIRQYAPSRANQIQVQVGEYNFSWTTSDGYHGYQGDDRFYTAVNTVWGASVAGQIAAAGGRGDEYADLNGALGLTFEQQDAASHYRQALNSPMPIYYGLEMFTGGNLFRGFGTSMVPAQTTLGNVEVYAAGNGNIVLINKDPSASQTASLGLTGFSGGSADVWQTSENAPFSPPAHVATIPGVSNTLSYSLPPYSVTTIVLNGGSNGGSGGGGGGAGGGTRPTNFCSSLGITRSAGAGAYTFTPATATNSKTTLAGLTYDFGDGTQPFTSTTASQNHVYAPGTYNVSVTVDLNVNGMVIGVLTPDCQTTLTVGAGSGGGSGTGGLLTPPVRINAGGGAYTDPQGHAWSADMDYSGGRTDSQAAGIQVKGTTMVPLFQSERYGNFDYNLPIANGTYTLRLYFAEIYPGCPAVGCRVFNVTANGAPVLGNFDIAAKVGDYTADVQTRTVTVTDNDLDLAFRGVVGSPQVSAIEVSK